MARLCAPEIMKARIADSSLHAVHVQNVFRASFSTRTPSEPGARFACSCERSAYQKNCGKNRGERMRKRVTEMNGTADRQLL
jgi:hypothetical protein